MKSFVLAIALLVSCLSFARDSLHYACSGFEDANKHGPNNYGFAVIYDEARGPVVNVGGQPVQTRTQTLSTVWAGSLYQARIQEKNFDSGTVILADKSQANKIFFDGSFQIIQNSLGEATMQLSGQFYTVPGDASVAPDTISTTLKCANISN